MNIDTFTARRSSRLAFFTSLACAVVACSKRSDSPSGTAPGDVDPALKPGQGFLTPALGPPDAIEPPARDIVPGMTMMRPRRSVLNRATTRIACGRGPIPRW
jgi:hypothetical protein